MKLGISSRETFGEKETEVDKQRFFKNKAKKFASKIIVCEKKAEAGAQGKKSSGTWNPGQVKGLQLERRGDHREEKEAEIHLAAPAKAPLPTPPPQPIKRRGSQIRSAVAARTGWLMKKGGGVGRLARRNWKNRYFTIMDCELKYYSKEMCAPKSLRGILPMKGAVVGAVLQSKYEFHFQVTHVDGRTLDLRADNKNTMTQWISSIQKAIDESPLDMRMLKNSPKHKTKKSYSKYELSRGLSSSMSEEHTGVRRLTIVGDWKSVPTPHDPENAPSASKRNSISKSLRKHWLFSNLSKHELGELIKRVQLLTVRENEHVVEEGTRGDDMFVLSSGKCQVIRDGSVVRTLHAGDTVGELSMMYSAPRLFTLVATSKNVRLWRLTRRDFASAIIAHSKQTIEHRITFLRNVPLFKSLAERTLLSLAEELTCRTYEAESRIIEQGGIGKEFYILSSGKVDFFKSNKIDDSSPNHNSLGAKVGSITAGDCFGELALLNDEPRQATALAATKVECLVLGRSDFVQLLGPVRERLYQQCALKTIQGMKFFSCLNKEEVNKLSNAMVKATFNEGEYLTVAGNSGDAFYIVYDGSVVEELPSSQPEKPESITHGGYLAVKALIGGHKYVHGRSFVAEKETTCLTIDSDMLASILGTKAISSLRECNQSSLKKAARSLGKLLSAFGSPGKKKVPQPRLSFESTRTSSRPRSLTRKQTSIPLKKMPAQDTIAELYRAPSGVHEVSLILSEAEGSEAIDQDTCNDTRIVQVLKTYDRAIVANAGRSFQVQRERKILETIRPVPFVVEFAGAYKGDSKLLLTQSAHRGGSLFALIYDPQLAGQMKRKEPSSKRETCHVLSSSMTLDFTSLTLLWHSKAFPI